jgi:hypothetical protein
MRTIKEYKNCLTCNKEYACRTYHQVISKFCSIQCVNNYPREINGTTRLYNKDERKYRQYAVKNCKRQLKIQFQILPVELRKCFILLQKAKEKLWGKHAGRLGMD